ncbi:hypothetical protein ACHAWF_001358 [Thalassiosira exigua]
MICAEAIPSVAFRAAPSPRRRRFADDAPPAARSSSGSGSSRPFGTLAGAGLRPDRLILGPDSDVLGAPTEERKPQSPRPRPSSRRSFLSLASVAAVAAAPFPWHCDPNAPLHLQLQASNAARAAETVGKDASCNDASCLGVWDGLLADCPHERTKLAGGGAGCVSSQDDAPGIFAEPWDYSESIPASSAAAVDEAYDGEMDRLILALRTTLRRGDDVEVLYREKRYLRALFADASGEKSVGEFYFTPDDTTVQFRIGSAAGSSSLSLLAGSLSNAERAERLRKALRYLKVPVLRNRKRAFFFAESDDLDGFGPGSAALGPPEEMSPGEMALDGAMRLGFEAASGLGSSGGAAAGGAGRRTRRGSDEVDPRARIDWVESFPFGP